MSLNEEFDELARRKLEERQIPFHEADWQDARKLIDAERGGRNRAAWITGAAVLLLMSGLVWYGTRSTRPEGAVATIGHVAARPEMTKVIAPEAPNTPALSDVEKPSNTNAAATEDANGPSFSSTTAQSIPVHSKEQTPRTESERSEATERILPGKESDLTTSRTVLSTTASTETIVELDKEVAEQPEPVSAVSNTPEAAIIPSAQGTTATDPNPTASTTQETSVPSSEPPAEATIPTPPDGSGPTENTGIPAVIVAGTQASNSAGVPSNTTDATSGAAPGTEGNMATAATMPHVDPSNDNVAAQGTPAATAASTTNTTSEPDAEASSTTAAIASAPSDSSSAPTSAAVPPPLVPARAPWEVSIFGGVLSSNTKYSGSNSEDWKGDISKENSIGIGAELMHMGRNIGIGTGLHYSTYAEQLRTDAVDHTTTTLQNFWYLMPVDTMILVITDTLPGTPPTYTGTSTSTTVDVLTQGTDTTTTTERIREARNEVNHVSYLEVPLLLDAHLVQGRWSFGLRGGPTVGLLTGRRGAIPAPDNEGYVAFTDLPFRELIVGYSARAYARYRFNAGWSVGIEPAMQGQLMNSLGSGELERKANAKGVMLSLSYRLR